MNLVQNLVQIRQLSLTHFFNILLAYTQLQNISKSESNKIDVFNSEFGLNTNFF